MEKQRKLDKLSKLAGLLLDNTITPTQAKQLVELLVNLNTKQKEDMVKTFGEMSDSFTQEAYTKLQEAVSMVSQKHSDALLEVRQLTNKQRKEHEARLEELQSLLVEIKSVKVENGKDADEELIVEKVLERIEIPEYKETILDDGKQIADKLNILEEVIDQKVIKGLTKKITDLSSNIAHNVIKGSSTTLVNGKLAKNINFSGSASVSYNGDNANVTITGGGSGAVDSVNGQTGIVVLDTGDIAEATDLNYVSDAQLTIIGNTSGTNTGDQDLSGLATKAGSLTQFVGNTAWRVFYSDSAGDITELALGADGTFLKSNGASSAPSFATPGGSGDVSKVGTPVNGQIGYWTGDGTLAGDTGMTYDPTGNILTATGFVGALTGNADTVTTNANLTGVVTSTGNATAIADNALSIAKTSGLQTALDGKLASSFTKAQLDTAVSDGNVLFVGDITQYTDELAQDAVGGIVANSTFINLAYNDVAPSVTASLSATGTPDNTTYLRGDNTWATISSGGATTALDNLASVAINTSLISDTNNTDDIGSTAIRWRKGWFTDGEFTNMITIGGTSLTDVSQTLTNKNLTSGTNTFPTFNQNTTGSAATLTNTRTIWGQNFNGSANVTGDITLGTGNITMTGSIGATAARATKVWTTDIESTNMPTVGGTSLSSTFQPLDADLTTIAGLTATTDNFIVSVASAWASRTPAQVRTTLGIGSAGLVATDLADLNEATIESAIDTLANLTSVQGRTIALVDAGADAIFGWDDSANQYANLSAADAKTALALVKADVGLSNVDNTSDANKPVSTATQTALDLKSNIASPTFTGLVTTPAIKITTGAGAGKILTSDADGDATWETPSGGSPTMRITTDFADINRYDETNTGAANTNVGASGLEMASSATSGSSTSILWRVDPSSNLLAGSPTFSCNVYGGNLEASGSGSCYFGMGTVTVAGTGHTFTSRHIGFKILKVSGIYTLYATQANGTTETASSALTTVVTGDSLDLICKYNGTSSADYYWRKNGGALSSATNLATNTPSTASASQCQFSVSNDSTANFQTWNITGGSFER